MKRARARARSERRAALWAALLGAGLLAGPLGGQEEIFARGNQLYQAGDWAGAIGAYQSLRDAGFESADLEYNLGNAHFKAGSLGKAILAWERARVLAPADADVAANLELARSLKADDIEPLPRFWLFSVVSWWVRLVPRPWLIGLVAGAWLALGSGLAVRILAADETRRRLGGWLALSGAVVVMVFGANLAVRELGVGRPVRAVIMEVAVPVRSAPSADDDLTLFEIHEGTTVRVDQRSDDWAEIVLEDGKVGWIPAAAMEII